MTMPTDNTGSTSGMSFADPRTAQRARDVIRQLASNTVDIKGSNPNVGRVMSVDIARLTASVWFTGDDAPVQVNLFPGSIPLDLGDYRSTSTYSTSAVGTGGLVYVEQFRGKPYITRILSGGEYELNANVAGLTHRTFHANYQGTISGQPVNDIYERHINIKIDADQNFVLGNALLVGPWAGTNDGSTIDGMVELTLTYWVTGNLKNCVRKYTFSVSDRMVVDLPSGANKPFWMRILPEQHLSTNPDAELGVDVSLVKTGIRAPLEMWIRLVPLDTWSDQTVYFLSVKTFGSAFNVGDPNTGRMVLIKQTVADPIQGWLGFNNADHGWTERDEYSTFPQGSYYQNAQWSTGPWRSSALRAAADLKWTWSSTGQWYFDPSNNHLFWEGNLVFKGIGPNWNALHTGSISVPFPSIVEVYPSDTGTFATQWRGGGSGGMEFREGETLYWGMMPGLGTGGQSSWTAPENLFFIVDSKTYNATQKPYSLPEWAVPIATRPITTNTERREIIICNPNIDLDDRTRYCYTSDVAPHNGIIGSDETETLFLPSFRYRKKTAYRVYVKTGASSATTGQVVLFRLRKGTTTAGAQVIVFMRVPMVNTTSVVIVNFVGHFVNDTTADIVTPLVFTGISTGSAATTWQRYADSQDQAVVFIEECGPSQKFAGGWPKLT